MNTQNANTIIGKYRHYKGKDYEVLCEAVDSETEQRVVVYKALYEPYTVWVRPYEMFFETVTVDGKNIARFERLEG